MRQTRQWIWIGLLAILITLVACGTPAEENDDQTGTIPETVACEVFYRPSPAQLQRPLEPIAAQLEPTRRVVYKTVGDRKLHLHFFEPEGHQARDRRPVFLMIHGGGWTGGSTPRGRLSDAGGR